MGQTINIKNNTGVVNIYGQDSSAKKTKETITISSVDKYSTPLKAEVEINPWGKNMHRVSMLLKNELIGQVVQQNYLTYKDESKAQEIFSDIVDSMNEFKRIAEEDLIHSAILVPKIWHKMASYKSDLNSPESDDLRIRCHNPEIHGDFMGAVPRGMVIHPVEDHFPEHNGIVKQASKSISSQNDPWYKKSDIENDVEVNVFTIGHIGAMDENHGSASAFKRFVYDWLKDHTDIDLGQNVEEDFVDLQSGRDFLSEDRPYSAIVLHFIFQKKYGYHAPEYGDFSLSPMDSIKKWEERIVSSNADFVFIFSDGFTSLSALDFGQIPGYRIVPIFSTTFFENYVFIKDNIQIYENKMKTAQKEERTKDEILVSYYEESSDPIEVLERIIRDMIDPEIIETHILLSQIETKKIEFPISNVTVKDEDRSSFASPVIAASHSGSKKVLIIDEDLDGVKEAEEWLSEIYDIDKYVLIQTDKITEIPSKLYHGTREENVDSIIANGLLTKSETRSISNSNTGDAIFVSESPDEDHYDFIIEIDFEKLLDDRRASGEKFPDVTKELPIEEMESLSILANAIGLDDYSPDFATFSSEGMSDTTWVIYEGIPADYLRLYSGAQHEHGIREKYSSNWFDKISMTKKSERIDVPDMYKKTLNRISSVAETKGLRLFAVGGFVRDLIMGKVPKDLDVMVAVENQDLAEKAAQECFASIMRDQKSINDFVQSNFPAGKKVISAKPIVENSDLRTQGFIPIKFSVDYDDNSNKKGTRVEGEIFETSINPSFIIANDLGSKVPRGESFGIYAVKTDVGEVEIAYPRAEQYESDSRKPRVKMGSLEEDANRRDFGMNALYLDTQSGEIEDPTGHGIQDIKDKKIRISNRANMDTIFRDDPLRILRAFRFMGKMGFSIDEDIIQYIRSNPELMAMKGDKVSIDEEDFVPKLSAERIREELLKIMSNKSAPSVLRQMQSLGVLKYVVPLPDEAEPWEFEQINPHHFENVWDHTLRVMESYNSILEEYGITDPSTIVAGNLVALLHDTGKLVPNKGYQNKKKDGDTVTHRTFVGHQNVSKEITEAVLARLKFPTNQINSITKMVEQHDRILDMDVKDVPGMIRYLRDLGPDFNNMLLISMADRKAHIEGSNDYEYLKDIYDNLIENEFEYRERYAPWVDGKMIMEITKAKGKMIGLIKDTLTEAQIDGAIQSPEQGVLALRTMMEILTFLSVPLEEVGINLLMSIINSPPYDNAMDWLASNYVHLRKLDQKPLLSPFLNGNELMEIGYSGKDIQVMKQEIIARMLSGDIASKEQAMDFALQMKGIDKTSRSYKPLRFSEFNSGIIHLSESDDKDSVEEKIEYVINSLESGSFDLNDIRMKINDEEWFRSINFIYNEDPSILLNIYRELREQERIEAIASFAERIEKEAQLDLKNLPQETRYGDVDEGSATINGNVLAGWGGDLNKAVEALNLIEKTSKSGLISNLWIGTSEGAGHLGVYEEELQGQGFRINLNEVGSSVMDLVSKIREDMTNFQNGLQSRFYGKFKDFIDANYGGPDGVFNVLDIEGYMSEVEQIVNILVLAEVMVHEVTHAHGAKDEGAPVENEKSFLHEAISMINEDRISQKKLPISLEVKNA